MCYPPTMVRLLARLVLAAGTIAATPSLAALPDHFESGHVHPLEPPVSVPMEKPTKPAAVAAPDPAEDPLEPTSGFHGLLVLPPNH